MKKIYLLLVLSLTFTACQKEELIIVQPQEENLISTVDKAEAISILSEYNSKNLEKSQFKSFAFANLDSLYYRQIKNSDELLVVIPAEVPDNSSSQILLLEVGNEVQAVVLSLYPAAQHQGYFTGLLTVRNLDGIFLRGYRAENGQIVSKLEQIKSTNKNDINGGELGECVVVAPSGEKDSVPVEYVFIIRTNDEPDRNTMDWEFEYSSGGGGGGTTTPTEEEDLEAFLEQDVWNEEDPYDDWNKLTECEKDFFRSKPYNLPIALANKSKAENAAFERFGNCEVPLNNHPLHNTIGDAYRHAYFAALNTNGMGHNNARALGDAHECETPIEYLDEKEMDLNNNEWGYLYGDTMSYINEAHFYTTFMDAVQSGQIKILQKCL